MLKSKQNSSLIVTKMESIPSTITPTTTSTISTNLIHVTANPTLYKQKKTGLSLNVQSHKQRTQSATCTETAEPKRRGRPPKKKNAEVSISDTLASSKQLDTSISDVLVEIVEDQKCLANHLAKKFAPVINVSENENQDVEDKTNIEKENDNIKANDNIEANDHIKENDNIVENDSIKENNHIKENVNIEESENIASTSFAINIKKEEQLEKNEEDKTYQNVVLEILSSDDETNEASLSSRDTDQSGLFQNKAVTQSKSKQRNFAAVSFLQESPSLDDEIREPEFIVAAVEEIICESHPIEEDSMCNDKMNSEVVEIHSSFNSLENLTTETRTECKKIRSSIELSDNSSKSLLSYDSLCEKDASQSSIEVSNNLSKKKPSKKKVSKYKRSTRLKSKQTKEAIDTVASPDKIDCSELVIETYSQNQLIDVAAVEEIETSTCEDNLIDKSLYHHTIEEFNTNVNANSTLQSSMNFENVISIESLPTHNIMISVMDPDTDQLIEVGQSDKEEECEVVQYEEQKGGKDQLNKSNKGIVQIIYPKVTEQKFENIKHITLPLKKQKMKLQDIEVLDSSTYEYNVTAESFKPQTVNLEKNSMVHAENEEKMNVEDDSKCENLNEEFNTKACGKDNVSNEVNPKPEIVDCTGNTKSSELETVAPHEIKNENEISEPIPLTTDLDINADNLLGIERKTIHETLGISNQPKQHEKDTTEILSGNQIEIKEDVAQKSHDVIECADINKTPVLEKQEIHNEALKEITSTESEKVKISDMKVSKIESHQRAHETEMIYEEETSHKNEKITENVLEICVERNELPNPSEDYIADDQSMFQGLEKQDNVSLVQTAKVESNLYPIVSENLSIENASSVDKLNYSDVLPEIITNNTINTQKTIQVEENIKIDEVRKVKKSKSSKNKLSSSRSKSRRDITTELSLDNEHKPSTSSRRQGNNVTAHRPLPSSNDNEDKNDYEIGSTTPPICSDNKEQNIAGIRSNDDDGNIIKSVTFNDKEDKLTQITSLDHDATTTTPSSYHHSHNEEVINKNIKRSIKKTNSPVSLQGVDLDNIVKLQSYRKPKDTKTEPITCTKGEDEKFDINTSTASYNKQSTETVISKGRRGRKPKSKCILQESSSQGDLNLIGNLPAVETESKNINVKSKNNESVSENSESPDSMQKPARSSSKKNTKSSTKSVSSNKVEKKDQSSQEPTENKVDETLSTLPKSIGEIPESSSSVDIKDPKKPKSGFPKIKNTTGDDFGILKEDMSSRSSPVSIEKKNKKSSKSSVNNKEKISKIRSEVTESSTADGIELNKAVKSKGRKKKLIEELNMVSNKNVKATIVEETTDHSEIENNTTTKIIDTLPETTKKDCLTEDEITDPFKNIAEFIEMGVSLLKKKPSETFEEDDNYPIVTIDDHHKPDKNNITRLSTEIELDENKKTTLGEDSKSFSIRTETKPIEDKVPSSLSTESQLIETETNIEPKETQTANNEQSIFTNQEYSIDRELSDNIANYPVIKDAIPSLESTHISENLSFSLNLDAFDTPADTPIATPTASPPPESSITDLTPEELLGVRRSHRIKQITKAPKSLVGRGLVRDKERLSMKDYIEVKSRYSIEDHRNSLADVTEENTKFLKSMEQRLSNFTVIEENEYKCERVISKEARKMQCDCFLTPEDIERGEWACGEDCLNRLLMIECGPDCNVGERCTNKRFQKILSAPCRVFRTEKKGFGIMAEVEILPGEFILEYVGEVIDGEEFDRRRDLYSLDKNRHYYFMALRSDTIIDATIKGNISRFINHSCDPNAETQKWTVNGEVRVGFFSRKSIMPGEEITFDYQYERYGREAQRCFCEAPTCRGWIGQEPTSDEGEQTYGTDDESSESESESIEDPMEAQKKLEMAAATANLLPIIDDSKVKLYNKMKDSEEAKLKLKNLLNKAKRNKQQQQKKQHKNRSPKADNISPAKARSLEDPDIEDEVNFLRNCGLKNQPDTLRLSRLMVRAKLVQTRLDLLKILTKGELPCRRLFLDYHGLRLLHGWMSENGSNMTMRLALLETLESLPIVNKTPLTDSKVLQTVRNWSNVTGISSTNSQSPSDESSSSSGNSQQAPVDQVPKELQKLAEKLTSSWENLPEIFRIPKRERIEQMKVHEREADLQYAAETQSTSSNNVRYQNDRFGRRFAKPSGFKEVRHISTLGTGQQIESRKRTHFDANNQMGNTDNTKHLSKKERREMFEAKMARSAEVKRMNDFETKCKFFGLDPKATISDEMPFCVNPHTGQWYNVKQEPIYTPPNFLAVQPLPKSTNVDDYELPPSTSNLKPGWKVAISNQGKIYYYNVKTRKSQWTPPTDFDYYLQNMCSDSSEGTSDSDEAEPNDELLNKTPEQLKLLIVQRTEERRKERLKTLVGQREISPRRDEDRLYNQAEMRKYKENKEKIRKRKEEIRRKRAIKSSSDALPSTSQKSDSNEAGSVKIQDYLLSSDEEENIKAECNNSPLLDKIVQGDKIVDELDALKTKRTLKRPLPPHRDLSLQKSSNSQSIHEILLERQEIKKRKIEKKTKKHRYNSDEPKYRKLREKFRNEIVNIIAQQLKPYFSESCKQGRICNSEDYMHLARKLTHFVMIKEIKYCESVGQVLAVTESVINKSREFIKKYMSKYGETYVRREDDPEFKDIKMSASVQN